jgi:SSS family solute:Na+ symporter
MDSNLASMATLYWCDIHKPLFPKTPDSRGIAILRISTIAFAILSTFAALAMMQSEQILDAWWAVASICGAGLLGPFLIGRLCPRVGGRSAAIGVAIGTLVIAWMALSVKSGIVPLRWRSTLHESMILVVGPIVMIVVGWIASLFTPRKT